MTNGIQADGIEALATPDATTGPVGALGATTIDVTKSVQAWSAGAANNGWTLLPLGNDGWDFQSAQGATAPRLTITYETGTTTTAPTPPPTSTPTGPRYALDIDAFDSSAPVAVSGAAGKDMADDPAILLHPTDLTKSVVLGIDKDPTVGRLYAFDLNGDVLADADVGNRVTAVDVLYRFPTANGASVSLVGIADSTKDQLILHQAGPGRDRLRSLRHGARAGRWRGLCLCDRPEQREHLPIPAGLERRRRRGLADRGHQCADHPGGLALRRAGRG
jgi:hypothetical protein